VTHTAEREYLLRLSAAASPVPRLAELQRRIRVTLEDLAASESRVGDLEREVVRLEVEVEFWKQAAGLAAKSREELAELAGGVQAGQAGP